jgi:hypothetical protein
VNTKLVVTIVLIVAVGVSYLWILGDDAEPCGRPPQPPATPTVELATAASAGPRSRSPPRRGLRARVRRGVELQRDYRCGAPVAGGSPRMLRGRVVDAAATECAMSPSRTRAEARATSGAHAAEPTEVVARADADGRSRSRPVTGLGRLQVRDGTWTTVLARCRGQPGSEAEMLLVVAPRNLGRRRRVDEAGTPVEGRR